MVPAPRFTLEVPPGFPAPRLDPAVRYSDEAAELGRHLFYDPRLSINERVSCASCHQPAKAFTDGLALSPGATGERHPRNSMALVNVVYNARQNWANPLMRTLYQQVLGVLFNEEPVELGWSGQEAVMLERLARDPDYRRRFAAAFPDAAPEALFTVDHVVQALVVFLTTMISGDSAFDRAYRAENPEPRALSAAARRGEALFFSERLECFHCHGGFNFSGSVVHRDSPRDDVEFFNTGLYNIPGGAGGFPLPQGNYPPPNFGLFEFTDDPEHMGRFRAPSLRNIALTAPYMHDGSIPSLREVITEHYARGGRLIAEGPLAGDGAQSPFVDPLMVGFALTEDELADLLAFLESLTDWTFLCREDLQDPFGRFLPHPACSSETASGTEP